MKRKRANNKPRWVKVVNEDAYCARCKKPLPRGSPAFYFPKQIGRLRGLYCTGPGCGAKEAVAHSGKAGPGGPGGPDLRPVSPMPAEYA